MIDAGFKLTATETRKLDEFKNTAAYGTYLKSIKSSPIYSAIVREYVKNIDIKEDVVRLQSDGYLPDSISPDTLNTLFKQSISRMAINIVADTAILLELENKRVDDVIHEITSDADVIYLLGTADEKYYKEAEKLLEAGKLEKDTVAYRGLVNWYKIKENLPKKGKSVLENKAEEIIVRPTPDKKETDKTSKLDFDSLDIEL